ncbi:MAG: F0F1 ATP synthase subunit epsilon [Desulfobacterales bacterium]
MAELIKLEIVTPQEIVVDEQVQTARAPGSDGEFGVLVGHTPFLSTLRVGSIQYLDQNGEERYVFVSGGFAEVLPDKITVLAEAAERRRDIDGDRVRDALVRAQQRLEEKHADTDIARAELAMARAAARLKLIDSHGS